MSDERKRLEALVRDWAQSASEPEHGGVTVYYGLASLRDDLRALLDATLPTPAPMDPGGREWCPQCRSNDTVWLEPAESNDVTEGWLCQNCGHRWQDLEDPTPWPCIFRVGERCSNPELHPDNADTPTSPECPAWRTWSCECRTPSPPCIFRGDDGNCYEPQVSGPNNPCAGGDCTYRRVPSTSSGVNPPLPAEVEEAVSLFSWERLLEDGMEVSKFEAARATLLAALRAKTDECERLKSAMALHVAVDEIIGMPDEELLDLLGKEAIKAKSEAGRAVAMHAIEEAKKNLAEEKSAEQRAEKAEAERDEASKAEAEARALAEEMMAERNMTQGDFEEMTKRWKKAEAEARALRERVKKALMHIDLATSQCRVPEGMFWDALRAILRGEDRR